MAFKLEVLRGSTTYVLSDATDPTNPFSVEEADLSGASVRNIEESGPYQDGVSHLDERLDPSTITLRIFVKGSSAATLDGHRDTLNKMFKPIKGVPITLKLTRDDGEIRHLDTRRTGPLAIPLLRENRPGNLHKAVVQLRAADPTWYDPTQYSAAFLTESDWWLGFNTIGTASVLEHVENPTQGQAWTNAGSAAEGSAWTIVFRSGSVTSDPVDALQAFDVRFGANFQAQAGLNEYLTRGGNGDMFIFGQLMSSGTSNYFVMSSGSVMHLYRDATLLGTAGPGTTFPIRDASSGTARWRASDVNDPNSYWPEELPNAAAYNIELNTSQRLALNNAMSGGSANNVAIAYAGDFDSYPIITIYGPLANPIITNTTTGDVLDMTGGTIGTADAWVVDTRYGRKSILNLAGSSVEQYLSLDSDLATFRLVADPIATGGTNVITLAGSAMGVGGSASLSYYNRYMGY